MVHAKLLDVLTSLPVNHVILPRAVCFATSRPANHAKCSFIDSTGYTSGPIRICLFIDYIKCYLRNEFDFCNVYGIVNTSGLLQLCKRPEVFMIL